MGKEKRNKFFAHQNFNKKVQKRKEERQREEEERRKHQEKEGEKQELKEENEELREQIAQLKQQVQDMQITTDALELANRENQAENTRLHEQVQRSDRNARQRQSRRIRARRGN